MPALKILMKEIAYIDCEHRKATEIAEFIIKRLTYIRQLR
jgi:hypothetical protein